ncbi:MAG: hypothetical protein ACFCAD_16845 [Pleurocapsa sp.]
MPNKRSSRRRVNHFSCPHCHQRLWRMNSVKYYLHYQNADEIQKNLNITRKKASFLANQRSVYVDCNRWIEEFFCSQHSTIWLLVSRQQDGKLTSVVAKAKDWQKTGKTIDPRLLNPSVSEYSYRMSRSGHSQNKYYKGLN